MRVEIACSARSDSAPTTSSVDPPPMSSTRYGGGAVERIEPVRSSEERQVRLPFPADHLERTPGEIEDGGGEPLAVLRVADRARGRDPDAFRVKRPGAAREASEHLDRAPERFGVDPAGPVDTLAESRDDHVARELGRVVAVPRRGLDHEQPDRVRPLIDRGDAAGPLVRMDGLDLLRDPGADRIDAARQVEGVVGVQALHAFPGAADAAVVDGLGQVMGSDLRRRRDAPR